MSKTHVVTLLSDASKLALKQVYNRARERKSDEKLTVDTEVIRVEGESREVHRVFIDSSSSPAYSRVGWVLEEDVDACMTCSKDLWFFQTRVHCHACGNINCSTCASNICLVEQLPDLDRGVPVCSQCYWGQEMVSAWLRAEADCGGKQGSIEQEPAQMEERKSDIRANMMIPAASNGDKLAETQARRKSTEPRSSESRRDDGGSSSPPRTAVVPPSKTLRDEFSDVESTVHDVTPLFVIKTKRVRSSEKVFVNVCTIKSLDLAAGEAAGAHLGLALNGGATESEDKSGESCFIFDVLINTVPSSAQWHDMACVEAWIQRVGAQLVTLINHECGYDLDLVLKFPKIKGNYKGEEVKQYTSSVSSWGTGGSSSAGGGGVVPGVKKGWLKKQRRGGVIKNWKSRYFVLTGGELQYYEEAREVPPFGDVLKGSVDLTGAEVQDQGAQGGLQFMVVGRVGREKNLLVEAEDATTKQQWMKSINRHIAYTARRR